MISVLKKYLSFPNPIIESVEGMLLSGDRETGLMFSTAHLYAFVCHISTVPFWDPKQTASTFLYQGINLSTGLLVSWHKFLPERRYCFEHFNP